MIRAKNYETVFKFVSYAILLETRCTLVY